MGSLLTLPLGNLPAPSNDSRANLERLLNPQGQRTTTVSMITLEEISKKNVRAVLALDVAEEQRDGYPRSNAWSIVEGFFPMDDDPVWMRAICNSGVPVGFMMTSEVPERGEYFLWRMMIDRRYQGLGYGFEAMHLLIKRIENLGNPQLLITSHLKGNAEAGRFYQSLGFTYAGETPGGDEMEMRLSFESHR